MLRAFAAGCSALTGVEAIANSVPAFRAPAVKRAQRTELGLGHTPPVLAAASRSRTDAVVATLPFRLD